MGGNCGIYEGTIVQEGAVIASGVIITAGTPIFDSTTGEFVPRNADGRVVVPRNAVVVSGSRPVTKGFAAEKGVHFLNAAEFVTADPADSIHMNEQGHAETAARMCAAVKEILG